MGMSARLELCQCLLCTVGFLTEQRAHIARRTVGTLIRPTTISLPSRTMV